MNPGLQLFSLFFFTVIFCCCNKPDKADLTKHYSDEFLAQLSKRCADEDNRSSGIASVDSLYNTFPSISVADKYRYYDFKRNLFELIRYGFNSYDTAILYTDSMIAVIEENRMEKEMGQQYANAFAERSEYNTRLQRYSNAIQDLTRCRQLNLELGDSCLGAENTRTLGLIAIRQSDFPYAASLLKEALMLVPYCKKEQERFFRMQRYLDDLGYVYRSAEKYDSALLYHLAAANYVEVNKQVYAADTMFPYIALQNIYYNTAVAYHGQGDYAEGLNYIKKAIVIEKDITKNAVELAKSQIVNARLLLKIGRIDEADSMSEKALLYIKKFELPFKADLLKVKVDIAKRRQQAKQEAGYQEWLRLVMDSIYAGRIDLLKQNPFTEYERLDKKYQVELLEKDNRNQQNKTNAAIAIGILVTLLAIISLYLLRRLRTVMNKRAVVYNKLVESERVLKETIQQKEAAEKQLIEKELFSQEMRLQMEFNEAIIQQRRKISDDMHDELSSSLAALKFYVADIRGKVTGAEAQKHLSDITDEVSTIYQNARSYMHSLKTNNWETRFNLIGFLKEIQQKFSEKGLMVVKLNLDEEGIKSLLSTNQHDQLYHIIREAISNVIKHADATELLITVCFGSDTCKCMIADNGIGFNKEQVQYGIGIQSIKNRVKDMQGGAEIESAERGTKITVQFPLN